MIAGNAELAKAVSGLVELRRAELGGQVTITPGQQQPRSAKRLAAAIHVLKPRYVLLVGDVDLIPTFTVAEAATDRPYGDFDGDGYPDASVGRLPFNDPAVVRRVANRIVAYERNREGAMWRRSCALVAGEGRFSPAIDAMIEKLFERIVSQNIALGYDVDVTYANPNSRYCFPPQQFAERMVERLNQGALVFAYVGHGQKRSLDRLQVKEGSVIKKYDVLGVRHVTGLRRTSSPAVFLAIACWTAQFEGKRPSIGEVLLAAPGGPVAFFGATRISHPVHNALLAKELVRELLAENGEVRLGPALDRARHAMVNGRPGPDPVRVQILMLAMALMGEEQLKREMPRHVDMYNLLGDPAMRLARPEGDVTFEGQLAASPGETLVVRGRTPARYRALTVSLETARASSARPTARPGESALERYARANDKVLRQEIVLVREGAFEVRFDLPVDMTPGRYVLKGFAQDARTCATGGQAIQVVAKSP